MKCLITLLLFIFICNQSFSQWNRVEQIPVNEVGSIYAIENKLYTGCVNKIYISNDDGKNWIGSSVIKDDITFISAISKANNRLFVGTYIYGVFESTDNGITWISRNDGLSEYGANDIMDIEQRGDSLYAATGGAAIWAYNLVSNTGWVPYRNGLDFGVAWNSYTIYNYNNTLYAGTGGNPEVYINKPGSDEWAESNFDEYNAEPNSMLSIIQQNGMIIGASNQGVYRSTDNGTTWQKSYLGTGYILSAKFTIYNNALYMMLSNIGSAFFFKSENSGESWELVENQKGTALYDFTIHNSKIFSAGYNGLHYRDLTVTSVDNENQVSEFKLLQNYPNPFNPATTISFNLPENSFVTLKVYDILGNEVSTLINDEKPAGNYEAAFDASHLSSGIYLCKLEAGQYSQTMKMILMK